MFKVGTSHSAPSFHSATCPVVNGSMNLGNNIHLCSMGAIKSMLQVISL